MNTTTENTRIELEQQAQAGNAQAQFELGLAIAKECNPDEDEKMGNAMQWLIQSADQGYTKAETMLGITYFILEQGGLDIEQVIETCRVIIRHDNWQIFSDLKINSKENLLPVNGLIFYHKNRAYKNFLAYLERSAQKGDYWCQYWLAKLYVNSNKNTDENYKKALQWFIKSATSGYRPAALYLAFMYTKGFGVAKDYTAAGKWLVTAEDSHDDVFGPLTGTILVPDNKVEYPAINFTHREVSADFLVELAMAQYKALLDQNTPVNEINKDDIPAWKFLNQLADNKCLDAAFQRIQCYLQGVYVDQNIEKAAEVGDLTSQLALAERYAYGIGVEKDESTALKWYALAADQGDSEAQYQLAYWHMQNRYISSEKEDWQACERILYAVIKQHSSACEWFMTSCLKFVFPYIFASKNPGQGYQFAFFWLTKKLQEYHEKGTHDDYRIHYGLGILYMFGKGCEKNPELAKNHLKKSIDLLPDDESDTFSGMLWIIGYSCIFIINNTVNGFNHIYITAIETDMFSESWMLQYVAFIFSTIKKETDMDLKNIIPLLEFDGVGA